LGEAYGVAVTDEGGVAVYVRHASYPGAQALEFYDRFEDIPNGRLPDDVAELAARALGQEFVVLLRP
jgi:hypothetical protein